MTAPRCSICIPTYNSGKYLRATIASALAQEYAELEVVVCDNASTDDTPQICQSFNDSRLRVVRYEELVGQAANWNRCLELARGEAIVLLHSDDLLRPSFARWAMALMDANPQIGMVHCAVQNIDQSGEPLWIQRRGDHNRNSSPDLIRALLLEGCVVNPAGVMVRRSVYERVGKFTEEIVWGVDWHMWTRIALVSDVGYLAEVGADYRQHPSSGTTGVLATARNGIDEVWMMRDLFERIPPEREDLRSLEGRARKGIAHRTWCFAEEMCRQGFAAATRAGVYRAVRIDPTMLLQGRTLALWTASYLGYDWFKTFHRFKGTLGGKGKPA